MSGTLGEPNMALSNLLSQEHRDAGLWTESLCLDSKRFPLE
jgi:hypothetical protein